MKRILLITSVYTGAGHKSISDALVEQFSEMSGVQIKVVDGFEFLSRIGVLSSRLYGLVMRHIPALYNSGWRYTMKHPPSFSKSARLCLRRFTQCLRGFHPDLILTVHSFFNTVLTRMLDSLGLEIPVVVFQADLVNIHSTWCNPRAYMTICPTREAYDASIRQGLSPEKLTVIGFPVRRRFCEAAGETDMRDDAPSRPLRCLLISGGEGSGSLEAYAESIFMNTDAELTVICGRNGKLHDRLLKGLGVQYGGRIRVLGFVAALEQEMLRCDLLVTRGSPNTLYEAVAMAVPFIVAGPLPEQEKDNPRLMEQNNLGVISRSPGDIPSLIRSLLDNNAERLREIRASQRAFRNPGSARKIAEFVSELTEPLDYSI